MAASLGITTAELIKLVETGQLTSDVLIEFADELNNRFGGQLPNALTRLAAAFGRFQNQVFRGFIRIGEGGAIDGFTNALNRLGTVLASAQVVSTFARIGVVAGVLAEVLAAVVANFDTLLILLGFFVGRRFAPLVLAVVAAFARWPAILRLARRRMNGVASCNSRNWNSNGVGCNSDTRIHGSSAWIIGRDGDWFAGFFDWRRHRRLGNSYR